ncbi:MAG: twitching motility protein PilT, partial [Gemmatimonadetes bacterium]|nr:twitching motility protein PilT [Gemmatimonadota bacterium]
MILADTSVWIDHLRRGDSRLAALLKGERLLMHPFVLGELACGDLRNRDELLELLGRMPLAASVSDAEAMRFIDRHQLMGRGVGIVNVHLLASTKLTCDARLWTRDQRLARLAEGLGLAD